MGSIHTPQFTLTDFVRARQRVVAPEPKHNTQKIVTIVMYYSINVVTTHSPASVVGVVATHTHSRALLNRTHANHSQFHNKNQPRKQPPPAAAAAATVAVPFDKRVDIIYTLHMVTFV